MIDMTGLSVEIEVDAERYRPVDVPYIKGEQCDNREAHWLEPSDTDRKYAARSVGVLGRANQIQELGLSGATL